MSPDLFAQLSANGIITGSYYALLGVSWTLIFATTRVFHFAHGLVFVVAAYTAVMLTMSLGLPLVVGAILAVVIAALVACCIELAIYRPLRNASASRFAVFIASLGVLILGQNVIQILFTAEFRALRGFPVTTIFIGPVTFTTVNALMVVLSAMAVLGLSLFLTHSKSGKAIRAVASNPEMAELVGINRETAFLLVYSLGSAAVALAAVPYTLDTAATPAMGMTPLFVAFTVTIMGGIGSIWGAVAGGLMLGLIENLSLLALSSDWKVVVSFAVLLAVIILKPRGLLGST